MSILDQLFRRKSNSARVARDRLIIALELQRNSQHREHAFMDKMKQEVVDVVAKYFDIDTSDIELNITKEGTSEVLALNINLPDKLKDQAAPQSQNHG